MERKDYFVKTHEIIIKNLEEYLNLEDIRKETLLK